MGPVPWSTVLAVALHDVVWLREDRRPLLDPTTGRPHDFTSCPPERKSAFVARGLKLLGELAPDLAAAVEAHHRALARGVPEGPDPILTRIRFFDLLSLRILLTGPEVEGAPTWLDSARTVAPDELPLPEVAWSGPDRATLRPYPFTGPQEIRVPCRDLPEGPYRSQEELDAVWRAAAPRDWLLRLAPPEDRRS